MYRTEPSHGTHYLRPSVHYCHLAWVIVNNRQSTWSCTRGATMEEDFMNKMFSFLPVSMASIRNIKQKHPLADVRTLACIYRMCCEAENLALDRNMSSIYNGSGALKALGSLAAFNSLQACETNARIVQCGLMPLLFFIGAPANILTMIVFYRQGLRDRMNLCLFSLAFVDLMYVTSLFITVFYCFIGIFTPDQEQFYKFSLVKHLLNFIDGFGYSSGFLTMIIATERCVCVLFPMRATRLMKTKTMGITVLMSMMLMQILCSVYVVKETVTSVPATATGQYRFVLTTTKLFLSHSFFRIIENIVLSSISFFSFALVVLTTTLTVIRLRSAAVWRKSTSSAESHQKGQVVLMKMLVAVSCIYTMCTAPNVSLALARYTVPQFRADGLYCNLFSTAHLISFLFVMFNSSINFFVYITMSSRFRHEVKMLSCRKRPQL